MRVKNFKQILVESWKQPIHFSKKVNQNKLSFHRENAPDFLTRTMNAPLIGDIVADLSGIIVDKTIESLEYDDMVNRASLDIPKIKSTIAKEIKSKKHKHNFISHIWDAVLESSIKTFGKFDIDADSVSTGVAEGFEVAVETALKKYLNTPSVQYLLIDGPPIQTSQQYLKIIAAAITWLEENKEKEIYLSTFDPFGDNPDESPFSITTKSEFKSDENVLKSKEISDYLKHHGYTLKTNVKTLAGVSHVLSKK